MPKICYVKKSIRPAGLAQIDQANEIISEYLEQGFKLTLRQLYYQFVSRDLIPNTVQSYKNLGSLINDARLAGLIDWDAIEDRTRNLRSLAHWENPQEIVAACASQFRIDRWAGQDNYVEVWIEKDALVGVIEGICRTYDVPYFACRGYTSQSEMWGAAQRFIYREEDAKQTFIIHLGDHDPSGIDMTRDIQERLNLFGAECVVERIALNKDQIEEFNPPPNPAKTTDARYSSYEEKYGEESWELDALNPTVIVSLVESAISGHLDNERWSESDSVQESGKLQLLAVSQKWQNVLRKLKV